MNQRELKLSEWTKWDRSRLNWTEWDWNRANWTE